ncbi:MAG: tRNA 2-thiouridine(34) synthase MnmA [Alphaproteobacteria bacterium]
MPYTQGMDFTLPPLVPGKTPAETTVVVAMSGGVDSSCVAALCQAAGYNTIGATLQLWDYAGGTDAKTGKKLGTCCALDDVYDAKLVCKKIGIPHHTLKIESAFKEAVIDDFVETYIAGATPIPCVRCNQRIKFDNMLAWAKEQGADVLVTGHYVRKDYVENGRGVIRMAADTKKDQTYYLFTTTQQQLDFINFPLGQVTKDVTRQLAKDLGLHVHQKAESFDICFVGGGDYRNVLKKFAPEAAKVGNIIRADGTVLAQHQGIVDFTVGQRKGLGGGTAEPLYVIEIRPHTGEVVVGTRAELGRTTFTVKDLNWLDTTPPHGQHVTAKVRAQHAGAPAVLTDLGQGRLEVTFHAPEDQISPGQAAVFYNAEGIMLGGGWIETKTQAAGRARPALVTIEKAC